MHELLESKLKSRPLALIRTYIVTLPDSVEPLLVGLGRVAIGGGSITNLAGFPAHHHINNNSWFWFEELNSFVWFAASINQWKEIDFSGGRMDARFICLASSSPLSLSLSLSASLYLTLSLSLLFWGWLFFIFVNNLMWSVWEGSKHSCPALPGHPPVNSFLVIQISLSLSLIHTPQSTSFLQLISLTILSK